MPQDIANGNGKKIDAIESLKTEYGKVNLQIKEIVSKKKDRNDLDSEETKRIRQLCMRAHELAKTLSSRVTDSEESRKYLEDSKRAIEAAARYGSVIKSKIPDTTFDDVKGLDEVKRLIKNFIFIAQNDHIIKHYKLDGGLGVLMYGPPGTGKTMVAEAIANAMRLPLFVMTPADIFKSYVGESEQAVKAIFEEIEMCEDGAILFIDECESIFSKRTSDTKDYKAAVTTELLQRMNGFGIDGSKRIMIAATNRPDEIDPAYLRFKRFSHLIYVPLPDKAAIAAIVQSRLKGIELSNITIDEIVNAFTANSNLLYSAADICGIIEKTCMYAIESLQQSRINKPIPLTREMFAMAFAANPPRLKKKDLEIYENFHMSK